MYAAREPFCQSLQGPLALMLLIGSKQGRDNLLIDLRLGVNFQVVGRRLAGKESDSADGHHNHQHKHQNQAQTQAIPHHRFS